MPKRHIDPQPLMGVYAPLSRTAGFRPSFDSNLKMMRKPGRESATALQTKQQITVIEIPRVRKAPENPNDYSFRFCLKGSNEIIAVCT